MNSTARQTYFQLDLLFVISWADLNINRYWGGMPHAQNLSIMWYLKNCTKRKRKMIKLRLVPLVGAHMTRTYGPEQEALLLAWRLPLSNCPHPDKLCWIPNNRRAPSTVNLVPEPDSKLHHVLQSSRHAILFDWNACPLPFSLFYWLLLVHPWHFSLNISTSGSSLWPP